MGGSERATSDLRSPTVLLVEELEEPPKSVDMIESRDGHRGEGRVLSWFVGR